MTNVVAVGSEDGEARWWLGAPAVFKATAAETGGRLTPEAEQLMAAQAAAGCELVG